MAYKDSELVDPIFKSTLSCLANVREPFFFASTTYNESTLLMCVPPSSGQKRLEKRTRLSAAFVLCLAME